MNIVIGNKWLVWFFDRRILHTLFANYGEKVKLSELYFTQAKTFEELALEIGLYKSKGEARRAGKCGSIQKGWTGIKLSKKMPVWIWHC